jgi:glycine betaine catabolism A
MRRALQIRLVEELLRRVGDNAPLGDIRDACVSALAYSDPARFEAERRTLFRKLPLAVAHASELPEGGCYVSADIAGFPLVIVRDREGVVRAFANTCSHRGTRLVSEARGRLEKAMVCRYHAWTYSLDGALIHVPHRELFPSLDCSRAGLSELPCEVRHGFVWVVPEKGGTIDVAAFLGDLDDDFTAFGLSEHHAERSVSQSRACDWKLVIEAFLEGYHAKYLHQRTIARFFVDAGAAYEMIGPHVRSVGARRELSEALCVPREEWDIRKYATVFYFVYPNSIFVLHPDWFSHIAMSPETLGRSNYIHRMLIPSSTKTEMDGERWQKTWALIEETVFQTEDLAVAESIQSAMGAGTDRSFRLGHLEMPIRHFHDSIERAIAGC